jgi:hypothetical protein
MRFVLGQLAIPHRMNFSAEGRRQLARLQRDDFKFLSFGWILASQQQESGHSCKTDFQESDQYFSFSMDLNYEKQLMEEKVEQLITTYEFNRQCNPTQ